MQRKSDGPPRHRNAAPASMQMPRGACIRHEEPGAPIEIVSMAEGKSVVVPITNRRALELLSDLSQAVARSITNDDRRGLVEKPRAGSRG